MSAVTAVSFLHTHAHARARAHTYRHMYTVTHTRTHTRTHTAAGVPACSNGHGMASVFGAAAQLQPPPSTPPSATNKGPVRGSRELLLPSLGSLNAMLAATSNPVTPRSCGLKGPSPLLQVHTDSACSTHSCMQTRTQDIRSHAPVRTCTHTTTYTHSHTHKHTHTLSLTHAHTFTHSHTQPLPHTCIHAHAHMHAHMCAYSSSSSSSRRR